MHDLNESISDVEKRRSQLEENVKRLRAALQHWQTWDAEYESLKEDIEAAPDPCTLSHLRKIHDEFQGELLTGKEIDQVFGLHSPKSRDQIRNVLQRRIDYVGKNIADLERQLDTAETRYADANASSPEDAEDRPITEIVEHLDDEDNVLSYQLNKPDNGLPKVFQALEKAGIDDLPGNDSAAQGSDASQTPSRREDTSTSTPLEPRAQPTHPQPSASEPLRAPSKKKSVSFAEHVQHSDAPPAEISMRAKRLDRIIQTAKEQESMSQGEPVIPGDEDPHDAALRRQMLQYSMGEIGAVVAELELEEGELDEHSGLDDGDEDFDVDDDDDDDDDDGDDGDDIDDRFGRSAAPVVTDKYRQRMLRLEQKLGIKSRFTERARQEQGNIRIGDQGAEHMSPSASVPAPSNSNSKKNGGARGKKGVRFAQTLGIAPDDVPLSQSLLKENKSAFTDAVGDVVESRAAPTTPRSGTKPVSRPSRFNKISKAKASNGGNVSKSVLDLPHERPQREETEPADQERPIIAERLVERGPSSKVIAPDEFQDRITQRGIALEHQRLRRKFMHRNGGFLEEDESVTGPLDETGGERVSRFKAARLSRQ